MRITRPTALRPRIRLCNCTARTQGPNDDNQRAALKEILLVAFVVDPLFFEFVTFPIEAVSGLMTLIRGAMLLAKME